MNTVIDGLHRLIAKQNLSEDECYQFFKQLTVANTEQQAAALALLTSKDLTVPEMLGALRLLQEHSQVIDYSQPVVDIVGTGGDGLGTFNISTAASLVVASCEVKVAKHGGRAASSRCGSTDVMEALQIPLSTKACDIVHSLNHHHYAYIAAPHFNPLLQKIGNIRRALGFRTFFNLLNPLANPIRHANLVIGVYKPQLVKPIAQLLLNRGTQRAMVVSAQDGMDELSICGATTIAQIQQGFIREYTIIPEIVGLSSYSIHELSGGDPQQNALIIEDIFSGKIQGAKLEVVLLNAAAGLVIAGRATDLPAGIALARQAIQSGKAQQLLKNLRGSDA